MRRWQQIWIVSGVACCEAACAQQAVPQDSGQTIRVPVRSKVAGNASFSLEAFVYRPTVQGKHPLVLLNHGSPGGDPKQAEPQAAQAKFFTDRGYIVLVPMRRGRGTSGGTSLEALEKNCDPASWNTGLDAAYEDVTAVIDFASSMPDVDATKVLLVGESRGGFLSVAYAAQGLRRSRVVGVINFVGGWVAQAEDKCPIDFNEVSFRKFGSATHIPELWLYGDNDQFYTASSIRGYPLAYTGGGGKVTFRLIAGVPNNGHWLPGYPDLWSTYVDQYLKSRASPVSAAR